VRNWYSGARLETAWGALHDAGEALLNLQPTEEVRAQIPDLRAALEAALSPGDPRLAAYEERLREIEASEGPLTATQLAHARTARRVANAASDSAHAVVRRWRNLLLAVGCLVGLLTVALAVVQAFVPEFLQLKPPGCEDRPQGCGDTVKVWQVEAVGAFGGAMAAVLALNRFSGFTDPHGLPLYQALLRVPMAAATSLLGAFLMQSGVLGALNPQSGNELLAYALLFGYAQEPLLRLVDRQAGEVLGPARGKNDPVTTFAGEPKA
jgi:hypothetical protein